ncbi:hypothetical protein H9L39_06691 [Fusarium oxysporum f. sp. albedinis]|nr:hypothetical protein H9L39_06691 [Fusarium oxysporum f. sp. albedinis]
MPQNMERTRKAGRGMSVGPSTRFISILLESKDRSGDRVHIQAAFPTDQVFNGRPEDNNHTLSDKHGTSRGAAIPRSGSPGHQELVLLWLIICNTKPKSLQFPRGTFGSFGTSPNCLRIQSAFYQVTSSVVPMALIAVR